MEGVITGIQRYPGGWVFVGQDPVGNQCCFTKTRRGTDQNQTFVRTAIQYIKQSFSGKRLITDLWDEQLGSDNVGWKH